MTRLSRLAMLLLLFLFTVADGAAGEESNDRTDERREMVARQLAGRGIEDDAVLRAMERVPRHRFVPEALQSMAYADQPLPIGYDQSISQPYIVALMSEVLELRPGQRVLEIGTGSGYQAAVLTEMGVEVYSVEIVPELGRRAAETLTSLGYPQVHVKIGDGYRGWPAAAPFDGIIVTCSPTKVPEPLTAQLAEGGRLVIPVGNFFYQKLVRLTKRKGRIIEEKIEDVRFVPMVNEAGKKY
jgi:protein-L-isoaspartate(D-aspartate) O-methyltransferase